MLDRPYSPWPRRLALCTALAALPLILFGGAVTTLRAGLAIDGWWVLEPGRGDHFLLFYPLEKWFRDAGTFTEHTHRLFGTLVGLLAIAQLVSSWGARAPARARWTSLAALLAVCAQGTLGGLRVLEASSELAFLHGVCAQAVFAVLAVNVLVHGREWSAASPPPRRAAGATPRLAWSVVACAFGEIVLGAWLRHSGSAAALTLHVLAVPIVLASAWWLARKLRATAQDGGAPLARAARRIQLLLVAQILLGILATVSVLVFSRGFSGPVSTGEIVFATLHVLFGALLLVQLVCAAMWTGRATASAPEPVVVPGMGSLA